MKCETCGEFSYRRSLSDVRGNITRYQDFMNISIPCFDKLFAEKKNLCLMGPSLLDCWTETSIATLLKKRFNVESQGFLYQIVTIDETLVRDFEPELKSQSNEWISPNSSWPKQFRQAQSKVKQMMIFAYDHRGIIMADRVPCRTSVTAAYYCDSLQNLCRKMHKNLPDLLGLGHSFCQTSTLALGEGCDRFTK
jgi:hypothetical protein